MHQHFEVNNISAFKQKVLNWLKQFNTFCFLDSCNYPAQYDFLVGAGAKKVFQSSKKNALEAFQSFLNETPSWLLGHLNYELTTCENIIHFPKEDKLQFPDIFFFQPEILITCNGSTVSIEAPYPQTVFNTINNTEAGIKENNHTPPGTIKSKLTRQQYCAIIQQLKKHLHRGDCYEINFCQEFFIEKAAINPFYLFHKLNQKSPNPFSGFYRLQNKWLLCASPERFIQKKGNQIYSQPIKGTLNRTEDDSNQEAERQQLANSKKDLAENVMIVDLVRNDFSRICERGSVTVSELFGIYTFPQVHQMISTISGTINTTVDFKNIMDATFPMGSMTGAPKIKVMHLIKEYEKSKRGIFSGALGYIQPNGDFDFNVVIRSMMYNNTSQYLSFQTGGGITVYSDAEKEWEESLLKAKAIKAVLSE